MKVVAEVERLISQKETMRAHMGELNAPLSVVQVRGLGY